VRNAVRTSCPPSTWLLLQSSPSTLGLGPPLLALSACASPPTWARASTPGDPFGLPSAGTQPCVRSCSASTVSHRPGGLLRSSFAGVLQPAAGPRFTVFPTSPGSSRNPARSSSRRGSYPSKNAPRRQPYCVTAALAFLPLSCAPRPLRSLLPSPGAIARLARRGRSLAGRFASARGRPRGGWLVCSAGSPRPRDAFLHSSAPRSPRGATTLRPVHREGDRSGRPTPSGRPTSCRSRRDLPRRVRGWRSRISGHSPSVLENRGPRSLRAGVTPGLPDAGLLGLRCPWAGLLPPVSCRGRSPWEYAASRVPRDGMPQALACASPGGEPLLSERRPPVLPGPPRGVRGRTGPVGSKALLHRRVRNVPGRFQPQNALSFHGLRSPPRSSSNRRVAVGSPVRALPLGWPFRWLAASSSLFRCGRPTSGVVPRRGAGPSSESVRVESSAPFSFLLVPGRKIEHVAGRSGALPSWGC
jgi:hypothetical protein